MDVGDPNWLLYDGWNMSHVVLPWLAKFFCFSKFFFWKTVCRASIRIYLNLLILNTVCRYFGLSLCKKGHLTFCTVLMLFCVSLFGAAFNAPFVVWENLIFAIVPKVRNQLFKLGFLFFSTVFRVLFSAAVLLCVSTCISLFFFFFSDVTLLLTNGVQNYFGPVYQ